MRKCFMLIVFFSVILSCSNAFALLDDLHFGWMPMFNYNSIHDPEGATKDEMHVMPVSGVIIYNHIARDQRLFGHVYYDWYDVKASTENIGQKAREFGANLSWQWMIRIARNWRPYLGVGLGYANEKFTNRYVCSSPSCQYSSNTSFSDRSVQSFTALVNASSEWSITEKWDVGVHMQFEQPLNGGSIAARAGIYITY